MWLLAVLLSLFCSARKHWHCMRVFADYEGCQRRCSKQANSLPRGKNDKTLLGNTLDWIVPAHAARRRASGDLNDLVIFSKLQECDLRKCQGFFLKLRD